MTDTIITVRGEYSQWYPAERATVHLEIRLDGPVRADVFSAATDAAAHVRESITEQSDPTSGPITWWSSGSVSVWWDRPWNNEGVQLEPVHHASVSFSVKFSDFDSLSTWLEKTASIDGAVVSGISWDLTDATKASVTAEVRSRSVKDAVTKATIFAHSIGLGSVTAVALADPGMLGDSSGHSPDVPSGRIMKASMMMADSGAAGLNLKPEEIEVASTVDARFVAR
jgi:hypothetical protein